MGRDTERRCIFYILVDQEWDPFRVNLSKILGQYQCSRISGSRNTPTPTWYPPYFLFPSVVTLRPQVSHSFGVSTYEFRSSVLRTDGVKGRHSTTAPVIRKDPVPKKETFDPIVSIVTPLPRDK